MNQHCKNGDEETEAGSYQGFGNAAGDGKRLTFADGQNVKGPDHADNGAEKAHQWRESDDRAHVVEVRLEFRRGMRAFAGEIFGRLRNSS